jgi:hypothetical protein
MVTRPAKGSYHGGVTAHDLDRAHAPLKKSYPALGRLVFAIAAAVVALVLGDTYIGRLPHHAGYFLVPVTDQVRAPRPSRPRHTVFIVVDGLGQSAAETMHSTRELLRFGQCRISDQGAYTVSRPEYALLSTGLEVDRTGSRNNELSTPLAAESIWEVARESGLRVGGSSHLPWFRQLFPSGFDRFAVAETDAENVFSTPDLLDVNVFHPLYVDEAGHLHGGRSPEYALAVARADREIGELLSKLDLTRDLVILTADHGHRAEGGHGGAQPEIRNVLACFAGFGVVQAEGRRPFDGRTTAPLLAVLLGVRFPRHMRAGQDGLDAIWEIAQVDASSVSPSASALYFAERRNAVERFREENRSALERMLGGPPGTWERLYAREAQKQRLTAAVLVGLALGLGALRIRRQGGGLSTVAWLACVVLAIWVAHHLTLGDFDYTVINRRGRFIVRGYAAVFLSALVGIATHARITNAEHLVDDWTTVVVGMLAMNLGHIAVYGWPLGFPLPPAPARYFPFFGSGALLGYALVLIGLVLVARFRRRFAMRGGRGMP